MCSAIERAYPGLLFLVPRMTKTKMKANITVTVANEYSVLNSRHHDTLNVPPPVFGFGDFWSSDGGIHIILAYA